MRPTRCETPQKPMDVHVSVLVTPHIICILHVQCDNGGDDDDDDDKGNNAPSSCTHVQHD